jgi:hypothetical protein
MKLFSVTILMALVFCFNPAAFSRDKVEAPALIALDAGGVYATKAYQSNEYHIAKVISIDEKLIALRYYKEDFDPLPQNLSTKALTVFIGKYITSIDDFTRQNPIKIGQEPVVEEELKLYQ